MHIYTKMIFKSSRNRNNYIITYSVKMKLLITSIQKTFRIWANRLKMQDVIVPIAHGQKNMK